MRFSERPDNASESSPSLYVSVAQALYLNEGERRRRSRQMGIVMIRCPETRRAISTGMQVDRATFHSTPVFFSRTFCPLCAKQHEWFAKDAWVCDSAAADYYTSFHQQVAQTFLPR